MASRTVGRTRTLAFAVAPLKDPHTRLCGGRSPFVINVTFRGWHDRRRDLTLGVHAESFEVSLPRMTMFLANKKSVEHMLR